MSDAEIEHWGGMITNTGSLRQFNVLDTENGKEIACTHLTGEGISEKPMSKFLAFFLYACYDKSNDSPILRLWNLGKG
ncbi:MAG: hypothetical protein HFH80_15415 [Lachnospiraceae bacterium]|nr:hypothetical protein [Lachnospiraceae bacterium]